MLSASPAHVQFPCLSFVSPSCRMPFAVSPYQGLRQNNNACQDITKGKRNSWGCKVYSGAPLRKPAEVSLVHQEQSERISTRGGDAGLCAQVSPVNVRVQETTGWVTCHTTHLKHVTPPAAGLCHPGELKNRKCHSPAVMSSISRSLRSCWKASKESHVIESVNFHSVKQNHGYL